MPAPEVEILEAFFDLYLIYKRESDVPKQNETSPREELPKASLFNTYTFYQAANTVVQAAATVVKKMENTVGYLTGKSGKIDDICEKIKEKFKEQKPEEWVETILTWGDLGLEAHLNKQSLTLNTVPSECNFILSLLISYAKFRMTSVEDNFFNAVKYKIKELIAERNNLLKDLASALSQGADPTDLNKEINTKRRHIAYLSADPVLINEAVLSNLLNHLTPCAKKIKMLPSITTKFILEKNKPYELQKDFYLIGYYENYETHTNKKFQAFIDDVGKKARLNRAQEAETKLAYEKEKEQIMQSFLPETEADNASSLKLST